MNVFISYSHSDEAAVLRLRTHLATLRNEGTITEWYDRKILPGEDIDIMISRHLESSDLFLLLISPDFLASDYCTKKEMKRALERHESGHAKVVPIIVEPCDWKNTTLASLKALPKDGKPVRQWRNEDEAYLDIVQELRRMPEADPLPRGVPLGGEKSQATAFQSEARCYRVKEIFDEIDRSSFRDEAFTFMSNFFRRRIDEINTVEGLKGRFFSSSNTSFSVTVINYKLGKNAAHITVHASRNITSIGDISFSFTENGPSNTANGWFTIKDDGLELYLSVGMALNQQIDKLTIGQVTEYLWDCFAEQAGIIRA